MFSFVREDFYRNQKFQGNLYPKPEESHEDRWFFIVHCLMLPLWFIWKSFRYFVFYKQIKQPHYCFFSSPLGMSPICFHYIIVVCRLYGCYCFWQYLFIATHSGRQGDIWLSWQPCVLFTSVYWVCYMEGWSRLNCRLHALPYQGEISGALRPIIFLDWLLVFLLIRIFELPRSACPIYIVTMGQQWMSGN